MDKPDVKITADLDTGETEVEKSEPSNEKEEQKEEVEKEAQVEVVPKEHYENLKKALQETRGKSRAELDALRRRLEATEAKLKDIHKEQEKIDIFEGADDEDALTVAGAKKLAEETKKMLAEKEQHYNELMGAMLAGVSELLYKREHPDYDELTEPYKDLLNSDPDFMRKMLADGIDKAPEKLYNYAKKQLEKEEVADKKTQTETTPLEKPSTMGAKSKPGSQKLDPSKLTIEEKRRLKPEEIDKMWQDMIK